MKTELAKPPAKESQRPSLKTQVQEILAVIATFSNLLLKETAALKKADFKTVDTLQADKKLFVKQYHAQVTALAARREEFLDLDLALREKLVQERNRFTIILNDNMYALELAQNSTKRLVSRILETARQTAVEERQTNYSSSGKAMSYKAASMSLSIDQNL